MGCRSRFLRAQSSRIVVRGSAWRAAIWTSRGGTPASSMVASSCTAVNGTERSRPTTRSGSSSSLTPPPTAPRAAPLGALTSRSANTPGPRRPALHHRRRRTAPPHRHPACGGLGQDQLRASDPRPPAHGGLPLAGARSGPGNRAGVDLSRVDRDHEPLPALPGDRSPSSGSREAESAAGAAAGPSEGRSAGCVNDSHPPPAVFSQVRAAIRVGAACRNRTDDLFITSESLCRLS